MLGTEIQTFRVHIPISEVEFMFPSQYFVLFY